MSLAVVGTGTAVGKTVVSALVLARYAATAAMADANEGEGRSLAYWKPVATGSRDERDAETVERLAPEAVEILPESYLFAAPLSPHLAARLEGAAVDPERLLADLARHRAGTARRAPRALVVEAAGGLLVPLTGGELQIDFLAAAGLPCLLVALSGLGTINHTLLSLEALRSRGIPVAGVVMNGPPEAENRTAIERFGGVAVVAEVPPLDPLDRPAVARAAAGFDPGARLAPYLERA